MPPDISPTLDKPCVLSMFALRVMQVRDCLLPHSFNLNPAIMSAVEVEMSNFGAIGTSVGGGSAAVHARITPTEFTAGAKSNAANAGNVKEGGRAAEKGLS